MSSLEHYSAPQFFSPLFSPRIFRGLIFALMPALVWALFIFGLPALRTIALSLATAGLLYYIGRLLHIPDIGAMTLYTALLIAALMPPNVAPFVVITAVVFAQVIVRWAFRSPESLWINPVTASLVFCYLLFPQSAFQGLQNPFFLANSPPVSMSLLGEMVQRGMSNWIYLSEPLHPLSRTIAEYINGLFNELNLYIPPRIIDGFIGWVPGNIGTVSAVILLVTSIFLLAKRIIPGGLVLSYFLSFGSMIYIFGGLAEGYGFFNGQVLTHMIFGNFLFGMFFLLPDIISRPMDERGMIIYGGMAGLFVAVFRLWGAPADGTVEALLLVNLLVPVLNKVHIWTLQQRREKEAALH